MSGRWRGSTKAYPDSQNFWIEHKRDDAVKFNRTLAKIDGSRRSWRRIPSMKPARSRRSKLSAACRSCHQVYRAT